MSHVYKSWVLWILVLVIVVPVLGTCMIFGYLDLILSSQCGGGVRPVDF